MGESWTFQMALIVDFKKLKEFTFLPCYLRDMVENKNETTLMLRRPLLNGQDCIDPILSRLLFLQWH